MKVRAKREYPDGARAMPRACHGIIFRHPVGRACSSQLMSRWNALLGFSKTCTSLVLELFASSRADVCINHNTSGNIHSCILENGCWQFIVTCLTRLLVSSLVDGCLNSLHKIFDMELHTMPNNVGNRSVSRAAHEVTVRQVFVVSFHDVPRHLFV